MVAPADSFTKVRALGRTRHTLLFERFLKDTGTGSFTEDVFGDIDVHCQRCLILDSKANTLFIDKACMLDGVSTAISALMIPRHRVRAKRLSVRGYAPHQSER